MTSKRILITGVSTYWGGRLAQALERDAGVDVIIGVSPEDPTCELQRTEFVRVGIQHALLRRLTGLIYFPITPLFPHLGPIIGTAYLPAKFRIRFLEPIPTDQWGEEPWEDKGLVQTVAEEIRGRIQEELYEMVATRRSVWLG